MKHGNEGGAPQHVRDRADVEAGQALVAGQVIEHGHFSPLHDAVLRQIDQLKRAELQQQLKYIRDTSLWEALNPGPGPTTWATRYTRYS
jgi:hypothetical protein